MKQKYRDVEGDGVGPQVDRATPTSGECQGFIIPALKLFQSNYIKSLYISRLLQLNKDTWKMRTRSFAFRFGTWMFSAGRNMQRHMIYLAGLSLPPLMPPGCHPPIGKTWRDEITIE